MHVLTKSVKEAKGGKHDQPAATETESTRPYAPSLSDVDTLISSGALDRLSTNAPTQAADGEACVGYLSKKAGGKHVERVVHPMGGGLQGIDFGKMIGSQWRKRYFVLSPGSSTLSYYKHQSAYTKGRAALGSLELKGCTVFLKEVHNGVFRFTAASAERELKLRAYSEKEYNMWVEHLRPHAAQFRELTADAEGEDGGLPEDQDLDDDDDADDELDESGKVRDRSATAAPSSRDRGKSTALGVLGAALGRDRGKSTSGPTSAGAARDRGASTAVRDAGRVGDFEGYLEKKQGGKDGRSTSLFGLDKQLGKWERRYFVLAADSDELRYYPSPKEYLAQRAASGSLSLAGAVVSKKGDPKDLAKGRHRFTVYSGTDTRTRGSRELKLRADAEADCQGWIEALTRAGRARDADPSDRAEDEGFYTDDDLSEDEDPAAPGNPFNTAPGISATLPALPPPAPGEMGK